MAADYPVKVSNDSNGDPIAAILVEALATQISPCCMGHHSGSSVLVYHTGVEGRPRRRVRTRGGLCFGAEDGDNNWSQKGWSGTTRLEAGSGRAFLKGTLSNVYEHHRRTRRMVRDRDQPRWESCELITRRINITSIVSLGRMSLVERMAACEQLCITRSCQIMFMEATIRQSF